MDSHDNYFTNYTNINKVHTAVIAVSHTNKNGRKYVLHSEQVPNTAKELKFSILTGTFTWCLFQLPTLNGTKTVSNIPAFKNIKGHYNARSVTVSHLIKG
jgi:hypothetical protein